MASHTMNKLSFIHGNTNDSISARLWPVIFEPYSRPLRRVQLRNYKRLDTSIHM